MLVTPGIKRIAIVGLIMAISQYHGYSQNTRNHEVPVLKLKSISIDTTLNNITDFDNNSYKTVQIGEQIWMRESIRSLHYGDGTSVKSSKSYYNEQFYADNYGRLYTWESAVRDTFQNNSIPEVNQGVCPTGWHIPTDNDWRKLINRLGGSSTAGGKMKVVGTTYWEPPNKGADNSSFFEAMPGGYFGSEEFNSLNKLALFWTANETSENKAKYVLLDNGTAGAVINSDGLKENYYSVRCIKNSKPVDPDPDPDPDPVSINATKNKGFVIYPNPVKEIIYIKSLENSSINVQIYNLQGQILKERKSVSGHIAIGELSTGVYIARIITHNQLYIHRFIKY